MSPYLPLLRRELNLVVQRYITRTAITENPATNSHFGTTILPKRAGMYTDTGR